MLKKASLFRKFTLESWKYSETGMKQESSCEAGFFGVVCVVVFFFFFLCKYDFLGLRFLLQENRSGVKK